MKRKPTGFVATCQCGLVVGAMDATRTDRNDAGHILGKWLSEGCTIEPRFTGTWVAEVKKCQCDEQRPLNPPPNCTCPSGDGSLRWPCPAHPPTPQGQPSAGLSHGADHG
jgi:hypothetical protein